MMVIIVVMIAVMLRNLDGDNAAGQHIIQRLAPLKFMSHYMAPLITLYDDMMV